MTNETIAYLHDLLRKESRSLLQYASESYPWTKAPDEKELTALHHIARAETSGVGVVVRALLKNKAGVPFPGAYPQHFTTMNFISWDYFLPLLIADQEKRLAELEHALGWLPPGDGKNAVQNLFDMKKAHLRRLRGQVDTPEAAAQEAAAPQAATH